MVARAADINAVHVGGIGLTFVPDGSLHIGPPAEIYRDAQPELFASNRHLLDEDGYLVMSLGALLVETKDKRVLIDLGWGDSSADLAVTTDGRFNGHVRGGQLLANLARIGLEPEDIDAVLISHLHKDHIGWLTIATSSGPALTFRRAEHLLAPAEWDFWQQQKQSESFGPSALEMEALAKQLLPLQDGGHPAPGIDALFTPGHTPGHFSFVISDSGSRAVVLGDTVHCPLEISNPELALLADVDAAAAKATREALFRRIDGEQTIVVGAHFPDLVFGRVVNGSTDRTVQQISAAARPGR
jgi:glyoxylase-like metal-dependent hydrolase (beta-lactamase superfamily II)